MVLFRPHRATLDEAMAEIIEIENLDDMIKKIQKDLSMFAHEYVIDKNTVHVEYYTYDNRIEWKTYIVTLDNFGVIGFTNGNLQ
jgi:hypothetical protein